MKRITLFEEEILSWDRQIKADIFAEVVPRQ